MTLSDLQAFKVIRLLQALPYSCPAAVDKTSTDIVRRAVPLRPTSFYSIFVGQ